MGNKNRLTRAQQASKKLHESKEMEKALKAAYDVCHTVNSFLANVLASDHADEQTAEDRANKESCETFLNWYEQRLIK